jgi:hypothetical protein
MKTKSKTSLSKIKLLFFVIAIFGVTKAYSQIDVFTGMFDKVKGVAPWFSYGLHNNNHYGFEFLLGPYSPVTAYPKQNLIDSLEKKQVSLQMDSVLGIGIDINTKLVDIQTELTHLNKEKKINENKNNNSWQADLGIGLDFYNGYRRWQDSINIAANIRGYYISSYLYSKSYGNEKASFSFYLGGTIGFYTLSNSTAYVNHASPQFDLIGNTVSEEGIAGLAFDFLQSRAEIFVEGNYKYLVFNGVQYKPIMDKTTLPIDIPHRFDLNGWYISLGCQFKIK